MQKFSRLQRWSMAGVVLAILVGLCCFPFDLMISGYFTQLHVPGDLRKAIHLSEIFGHSSGSIVLFGTLLWIDERNRRLLIKAAVFVALCSTLANAAKYVVPRYRPYAIEQAKTEIASSWDTLGQMWTGSWFDEAVRSFPSGHSATAVALAVGLSVVYPRGRWIFAGIASAACFQRLVSSSHFVSDIMGGIAIALSVAVFYWYPQSAVPNPSCALSRDPDCEPDNHLLSTQPAE